MRLFFISLTLLSIIAFSASDCISSLVFVIRDNAEIRSGPSTTFEVITTLHKYSVVEIIETNGNWTKVRLPQNTIGWVLNNFIEDSETSQDKVTNDVKSPTHNKGIIVESRGHKYVYSEKRKSKCFRWFFAILNKSSHTFDGKVQIILTKNDGRQVYEESFKGSIVKGGVSVVYIDTATGPPNEHGKYGITGFEYIVEY